MSLLTEEEKNMKPQRKKIRVHYLNGLSNGFVVGVVAGLLLFRDIGKWVYLGGLIAIILYFSIGHFETKSYNQIKDAFVGVSE